MLMEQFVELIEMLGDAFLPVQPSKLGDRVSKLFNYLKSSEQPTEEVAARKVGVISGSADFRKVKHHLKLALINGVVAIKSSSKDMSPNRKETNHKVWNYVSAAQSDLGPVKDFIATDLIGTVIEPARHFDLQEPLLVAHLSLINSEIANLMRSKPFLELCQKVHTEIDFDYKLQIGHKHLAHSNFLNIKRASNAEKISYLAGAVAEINEISAENRFRTMHASLYLGLKLRFAKRDYDSAIDFIEKALPQYDPTNARQRPMVRVFQNNLLRAFLYTCRYEEGVNFGCRLLEKETSLKATIYASQELTMMLALRSGDYQVAYRIYKEVVDAKVVNSLNHNYKETFLIIKAYLYLLVDFKLIDTGKENVGAIKLKIGRFINDMSLSSKEKKRRNIHVIIIKLLNHYLNKKSTDFDMADAIRKYVQRHLNDSKTIRAKNFILALVLFLENGFNCRLIKQAVEKHVMELNNHPVGQNDQDPFGELVTYDSLWNHLISDPNK
jgi:tetratricopeptide (TPR) repeat protein